MSSTGLSALGQRTSAPPISWLMSLALARPKLISLAVGFTDQTTLPVKETRALFETLFDNLELGQKALQYGTTAGLPELRHATADRLRTLDKVTNTGNRKVYDPDRVLITNGSQQLLYLTSECLCDPNDIVLVEDPTYFVYLGIAQSHQLRCRGVRMLSDGLDLEHLEQRLEELKRSGELPRLKMLYSVSYFQNPSGVSGSFDKKKAALKLLRRYERDAGHPIYFFEDAAYRELGFIDNHQQIPSALRLPGAADRVIYAGTYSKPFATGARVGFGLLPKALHTCALRVKGNHDFGTANLVQYLLLRAIESGTYDRHLRLLQKRYQDKAQIMSDSMRKHFPASVQWIEPCGGLYIWVRLPRAAASGTESKLFKSALENNVLFVPGQLCYADDPSRRKPNREMRLSFGGASERNIKLGIQRLGEALKLITSREG